jgi:hypothetical protein
MFRRYVTFVSDGCCKSRSQRCISYNGCTRMLQRSAYVSHICCLCFIWMLRMFAIFFKCFHVFFQVFQKHVSSISSVFRRILQVLHLDVLKVDRVLHLSSPSAASPRCLLLLPAPVGHPPLPPPLLDASDVRDSAGPAWARKTARETDCWARASRRPVRPDV